MVGCSFELFLHATIVYWLIGIAILLSVLMLFDVYSVRYNTVIIRRMVHNYHTNLCLLDRAVHTFCVFLNMIIWSGGVILFLYILCSGIFEINCSKDIKVQGIIGPCASLEKV